MLNPFLTVASWYNYWMFAIVINHWRRRLKPGVSFASCFRTCMRRTMIPTWPLSCMSARLSRMKISASTTWKQKTTNSPSINCDLNDMGLFPVPNCFVMIIMLTNRTWQKLWPYGCSEYTSNVLTDVMQCYL